MGLSKKRFIAGAECPACKSLDTLYLLADELNGAFECVECGHREEPPTEPTQIEPVSEPETEAVKFVDATKTN